MIAVADKYKNLESNKALGVHSLKIMLYGGMISMGMFFVMLTSALLVKKGDSVYWAQFKLPSIFLISTLIIIAGSILMHWSKNLYQQGKFALHRVVMLIAIVVGFVFLGTQLLGFQALKAIGMPLDGNASGSFIWIIAMAHGLHIVGGLGMGIFTWVKAYLNRNNASFEAQDKTNPRRVLSMELLTQYWHFVDILWVYLYIFFYFNY